MAIDFERECFFIAPIGEDDTPIRKRSDGVRDLVVKEAAEAHGLETRRADDVGEPGQITSQVVNHCLNAKMCVADLTEGNPNVYYELSIRHGKQMPVVLIAEVDTPLPFDVGQSRVIFFEARDLSSALLAREAVREQIGAALEAGVPADNPIANGMRLAGLQGGSSEDDVLLLMMERLERLGAVTADIDARMRRAEISGRGLRRPLFQPSPAHGRQIRFPADISSEDLAAEGFSRIAYPEDEVARSRDLDPDNPGDSQEPSA